MEKKLKGLFYITFFAVMILVVLPTVSFTQTPGKLTIGLMYDLTGPAAELGRSERDGAAWAIEEWKIKHGKMKGREIEYVEGDDMSDASRATTIVKRMLNLDKIVALSGSSTSSCSIAACTVAKEVRPVPVVCGAAASKLFEDFHDICFSGPGSNYHYVRGYFPQLQKDGKKTIAVIYDNYAWGIDAWKWTKKWVDDVYGAKNGMKVVAGEPVELGTENVTAQLIRLKKEKPDCLIGHMIGTAESAGTLRGLVEMNWGVQYYTLDVSFGTMIATQPKEILEGVKVLAYWTPKKPYAQKVMKEFEEKRGKLPPNLAGFFHQYDVTRALLIAMARANDPTNCAQIVAQFEKIRGEEQATGTVESKLNFGPETYGDLDHSMLHSRPFYTFTKGEKVF